MASDGELLTVIVPCYNEERTVAQTVEEVVEVASRIPMRVEVLLIDDGSTDATASVMEDIVARHSACRMIRHERNRGVGRCVLEAYDVLPGDSWGCVVPGDGEIVVESLLRFVSMRHDYDIILGYLQNMVIRPFFRRMASMAFTGVVNWGFGYRFRYLNGLKLYRISAFKGLEVKASGHAFNAELLGKAILRNPSLRIGEAPYLARGRARGHSKAIRPGSVARAVYEVAQGYREVARFREEVIRAGSLAGPPAVERSRARASSGERPDAG